MPVFITQPPVQKEPPAIQLSNQDEVDQILGHPPSWLLRYGISLVFLVTIIFGALAWLIKYPDVIVAPVQIATEHPAIRIIAPASGRIAHLFVDNHQPVEKGDQLAIISNPVAYADLEQLEGVLDEVATIDNPKDFLRVDLPEALVLGQMQTLYASLLEEIEGYQYYLKQTNIWRKIWAIEGQIVHIRAMISATRKQQRTMEKEVAIAHKNYLRNKQLHREKVISDLDLEKIETSYLQYQRQADNFQTQISSNKVQIEQLEAQIIDLRQGRKDGRATKELVIKELIQNLKSQIAIWKETYLVTAPIAGKVNLATIWSANQFVTTGEELLTIVPMEGAGKIIAKAQLPTENSGKVQMGQQVTIRLSGYPYQEYGVIRSEVEQMSLVPQQTQEEAYHLVALAIPDSLVTTYDKRIPFVQEMTGTAHIITEDRRILQRVFDKFWSIVKNT